MALLSSNRIAWTYTADDGTNYRVAAEKALTDQAKQGGSDGSAVGLAKPAWLKMRRVTVRLANGTSRVMPLYEVGAPLATAGETINVNSLGDSRAGISTGNVIGQGHIRQSVTHQST